MGNSYEWGRQAWVKDQDDPPELPPAHPDRLRRKVLSHTIPDATTKEETGTPKQARGADEGTQRNPWCQRLWSPSPMDSQ